MWLWSHAGLERTPVPRHQEWTVLWPGSLPILTFWGDSTYLGSCLISSPPVPQSPHPPSGYWGSSRPFWAGTNSSAASPGFGFCSKGQLVWAAPGHNFWSQASGPAANTNCGCRLECGGWRLAELWKLAGPKALLVPQSRALVRRVRPGQASKPQAAEPHCHITE